MTWFRDEFEDAVQQASDLHPTARLICWVYARFASGDQQEVYCPDSLMQARTGIKSKDTLTKHRAAAMRAGWLVDTGRRQALRGGSTPIVRMHIPDEAVQHMDRLRTESGPAHGSLAEGKRSNPSSKAVQSLAESGPLRRTKSSKSSREQQQRARDVSDDEQQRALDRVGAMDDDELDAFKAHIAANNVTALAVRLAQRGELTDRLRDFDARPKPSKTSWDRAFDENGNPRRERADAPADGVPMPQHVRDRIRDRNLLDAPKGW